MNNLYYHQAWDIPIPPPYDVLEHTRDDISTAFNNTLGMKRQTKLFAPLLYAVSTYIELLPDTAEYGYLGKKGTDVTIAEFPAKNKSVLQAVTYNRSTGRFSAMEYPITDEIDISKGERYIVADGYHSGACLFFALLPELHTDAEFRVSLDEISRLAQQGYSDLSALSMAAHTLCDNAYRRITYADDAGAASVKVDIPSTGLIPGITKTSVKKRLYRNTVRFLGSSKFFDTPPSPIEQKEFCSVYRPKSRQLSVAEQALVPKLPDHYQIPPEAKQICEMICDSKDSALPINNLMFRGPSGTGKTSLAKAIAAGLGLPYVFQTCSPDYEIFDFVGQEYPRDVEAIHLPTLAEIKAAPSSVYFNLSGIARGDVGWEDIYEIIYRQMHGNIAGNSQFEYVTSPFLDAMQNGWVCEIQEADIINKPGVLTGLNSMLDDCRMITLPNKQVVKRHKDAILILTGNTTYNGCRELNQATLSRMSLIYDFDALTADEMAKRAMAATGCTEKTIVKKMAKITVDISDKCERAEIRDGVCGYREFVNWVQAYMLTHDILGAAKFTILSHATSSWEDRKAIENEIINTKLAA